MGVYKDKPLQLSSPLILNLLCNPLLQLVSWILSINHLPFILTYLAGVSCYCMLPTIHPNPNFPSPFPLPEIKDIRLDLWSQHLLKSLSVNQTRGQLVHCPYYRPFSSLDQGAPTSPFFSTVEHYFEWCSIYTHQPLAIVSFMVHPAYHTDVPVVHTQFITVSLALSVGGISLLPSPDNSLPGCKEFPNYTTKKKVFGCSPMPSPTSPLTSGSQFTLMTTSRPTSDLHMHLSFPSSQTTHCLLHLWCPTNSKQASSLTEASKALHRCGCACILVQSSLCMGQAVC